MSSSKFRLKMMCGAMEEGSKGDLDIFEESSYLLSASGGGLHTWQQVSLKRCSILQSDTSGQKARDVVTDKSSPMLSHAYVVHLSGECQLSPESTDSVSTKKLIFTRDCNLNISY